MIDIVSKAIRSYLVLNKRVYDDDKERKYSFGIVLILNEINFVYTIDFCEIYH